MYLNSNQNGCIVDVSVGKPLLEIGVLTSGFTGKEELQLFRKVKSHCCEPFTSTGQWAFQLQR